MANSLTEENYLKALFNTANKAGEVNVAELSKTLEIKMPTVTSMMKKLADKANVDKIRELYTGLEERVMALKEPKESILNSMDPVHA